MAAHSPQLVPRTSEGPTRSSWGTRSQLQADAVPNLAVCVTFAREEIEADVTLLQGVLGRVQRQLPQHHTPGGEQRATFGTAASLSISRHRFGVCKRWETQLVNLPSTTKEHSSDPE